MGKSLWDADFSGGTSPRWSPKDLAPGEEVVWCGFPLSRPTLAVRYVPQGLGGLVLSTFAILWMTAVVHGGNNKWDRGRAVVPFAPHNVVIASVAGVCLLPRGLAMLTSPIRAWRRAGRTCYTLTTRRAIVTESGVDHAFYPSQLRELRLDHRGDGSGDLVFGTRRTLMSGMTEDVGFLDLAYARDVEALVLRTLGSSDGLKPAT